MFAIIDGHLTSRIQLDKDNLFKFLISSQHNSRNCVYSWLDVDILEPWLLLWRVLCCCSCLASGTAVKKCWMIPSFHVMCLIVRQLCHYTINFWLPALCSSLGQRTIQTKYNAGYAFLIYYGKCIKWYIMESNSKVHFKLLDSEFFFSAQLLTNNSTHSFISQDSGSVYRWCINQIEKYPVKL